MIHRIATLLFLIILLGWQACKTDLSGNRLPNQAPQTYTVADTIARSGDNRFTSQVFIQWWGDDADGFIKGFEFSFDGLTWNFTEQQDSTFTLALPAGSDTADFRFFVRAIDNNNLADPTPANLSYPVKNSKPIASFFMPVGTPASPSKNPVSSFPALKYYFNYSDPDGADNLDHLEFFLNDTTLAPFILPVTVNEVTLLGRNLSGSITDCQVFAGTSPNPLALFMQGLRLNANNMLYFRSVDKVGATSAFAASAITYVKKPINGILLVNATFPVNATKLAYYCNALNAVGISTFDTLQPFRVVNNNYTDLSPDYLTQSKVFRFFSKIIWFSDVDSIALSLAQRSTSDFFANGGRMFMSVAFSQFMFETSPLLEFTPVKEIVPDTQGVFRMNINAPVVPLLSGWPNLKSNAILSSARPYFKALDNSQYTFADLYKAEHTVTTPGGPLIYAGPGSVFTKRTEIAGSKTNMIFTSLPLERLDANNNRDSIFRKIFIDELNF